MRTGVHWRRQAWAEQICVLFCLSDRAASTPFCTISYVFVSAYVRKIFLSNTTCGTLPGVPPSFRDFYHPARKLCHPARIFCSPARVVCNPAIIFCNRARMFFNPTRICCAPAKIFCNSAIIFFSLSKMLCEPARMLF